MIHSVEQLEAELLQLPIGERARLAERLITSLDEEAEVEASWSDEVQRRLVAFDAGEAASFPAEEVIAEALGHLA
ncbi:MAG: addiction module protein [Candidatus Methylumidiphilus sp.]